MKYTKLAFHGHTKKTKSIKQKKIHTEIANFLFWSFPTPQVIIGSDPWERQRKIRRKHSHKKRSMRIITWRNGKPSFIFLPCFTQAMKACLSVCVWCVQIYLYIVHVNICMFTCIHIHIHTCTYVYISSGYVNVFVVLRLFFCNQI